ncbi:MAG: lipid-A-disaccharide synthase [Bacteroidetes bacterium]|nr:lipid-A-disaccharide synthase [Bacteroidota bacterium]
MKYYVIAGEASGDLHGANLLAELKKLDANASFRCWGGDKMKAEGAEVVKHIKDLAFMGFVEVLLNIRTIARNIRFCKEDLVKHKPDVLILIDYPGFNLRIAEFAHSKGISVFFYISPTIWAWKESRVEIIKRSVDHMFVILPFEKAFYAKHNCVVDYEGHPLVDEVEKIKTQIPAFDIFVKENGLSGKPLIACMPGSRKQEIKVMLAAMLKLRNDFPAYEFVVVAAPNLPEEYYRSVTDLGQTKLLYNKAYQVLQHAHAGLIKSGTSVLEAALFHLPQVCCYYGNGITIWIAKRLAKVKYISLPNLILDKPVVTELIQEDMNYERMKSELHALVNDPSKRNEMEAEYKRLDEVLGGSGASERIAKKMYEYLIKEN